ncbi:ABC transporter substrate-binding protein [Amorphus sp. 3PC139-8]|uniref:ABC transporter substrate-binding protein n=1 Tax=Amorphus sp. 3PC139-8 TaxID=2735676 RepID=UPI00345DFC50
MGSKAMFDTMGHTARRVLLTVFVAAGLIATLIPATRTASAEPITVTDMRGRKVTLPEPAERVVLPEGRHILTLALLDDDPASLLAGWGNDLERYSPATYEAVANAFPAVRSLPIVGGAAGQTVSMEAIIAADPDLVVFTLYGPAPEGLDRLDAAGIPYVFVDFFQEPLRKTVPSMRLLGAVLGREDRAEAFVAFYEQHMNAVAERLSGTERTPDVFFHLNPNGRDCCVTSGPGNMSDFIAAAGGHNIGADKVPGAIGRLSLEYVLAADPDFYLAGGGSTVSPGGLKIGPGVSPDEARTTLEHVAETPGVARLGAIETGRGAGIWLFFFDNPLFFVGVEAMATLLHPELFADVDPEQTLATLERDFLSIDLAGTFWMPLPTPAR